MKTSFLATILAPLALTLLASVASAQYKYVGPDGRVIYSDSPPPASVKRVQKPDVGGGAPAAGASNLPYELGLAAKNFPVTLYTAPGCEGCNQGRTFLSKRGVPFAEKTITTNDDLVEFKRVTGGSGLPVMTVGGNKLLGFEPTSWGASLDIAGYPAASVLPQSYRPPAATALVPQKPAAPTPVQATQGEPKPDAPAAGDTLTAAPAVPQGERPVWFRGF